MRRVLARFSNSLGQMAQWNRLADRDVFVLPGSIMNTPDYFRISLTASDSMVERALPTFAEAAFGPYFSP